MAIGPNNRFNLRTDRMSTSQAYDASIDTGLRKYMLGVYNYMALGVAFTGILAMVVAMSPQFMAAVALGPFKWVLFLGILGLGFFGPRLMMTGSTTMAHGSFWLYAGMWGLLLSPMLYAYAQADIARAFFATAGAFAATSLYGYTTKRDLSGFATFFMMATIGLLITMLLNVFFFESSTLQVFLSAAIVLVFAGITAWETQMIKNFYRESDSHEVASRKSIFGAFMLYGSFITMFIHILHLFGAMNSE